MRTILAIGLILLIPIMVLAQESEADYLQTDTVGLTKDIQILGLPMVFYTPETEFGFGGGAQVFLNRQTNVFNNRLSNILATAIYTSKKQLLIDIRPQIFFSDGLYYLDALIKYRVFPNSFWGIGPQTKESDIEEYNMRSTQIQVAFLFRIPPNFNFGVEYLYENHSMIETEEGGKLSSGSIPGSQGAKVSGLNVVFNLDDRDNVFSARRGQLVQVKAGFSSTVFGADFAYNKYTIDFRKFISLNRHSVFAFQVYLEDAYGDVPFQTMGWLGGGERMRGYYRGRYIDQHYYALQTEYRYRFHSRWALNGFVSMGEVADNSRSYLSYPRFSFGAGIRFQVLKSNQTLLRFDLGFGESGSSGFYFGVNEAF